VTRPVSVILADDHTLLRDMLARHIEATAEFTVLAGVGRAEDAVALTFKHKPDIVVLDIDMPGLESFEAARRIKSACPDTRVVFLTAFVHDRYIERALSVSASGYLTKGEPPATLVDALRAVAGGAAYYSPEVADRIVFTAEGMRLAQQPHSRASALSGREVEILRYLARGMSKKQIAQTACLSERTVNRHCANLMGKLDIHDRVELTRFAIREGLADA